MFSMQFVSLNLSKASFQLSSAASWNLGQSKNGVLRNGLKNFCLGHFTNVHMEALSMTVDQIMEFVYEKVENITIPPLQRREGYTDLALSIHSYVRPSFCQKQIFSVTLFSATMYQSHFGEGSYTSRTKFMSSSCLLPRL